MALCLCIGTADLWRLDARCVVTDVLTYRSGFIFNGQFVQEGCTWTEDRGSLITLDNKFQKFFVSVMNMLLIYLFASMKLEMGH